MRTLLLASILCLTGCENLEQQRIVRQNERVVSEAYQAGFIEGFLTPKKEK